MAVANRDSRPQVGPMDADSFIAAADLHQQYRLVSVLVSIVGVFRESPCRRSSLYFCGQWHSSQVSRAGRKLWTGVGIGRG